ncbi:MAG TPA: hypothetical protein VII45_04765 [Solirubrobacterales bacterium]
MRRETKKIGIVAIVALAFALAASLAHAELSERGDLFVKFNGGIAPNALPRHARAPISVSVGGTVKTLSGDRPPPLRLIAIAINRGGRLDTRGLPTCRQGQIETSSTREALEVCRPALVGRGTYVAAVAFPEQSAFPSRGKILAFNAVVAGRRAILAHVYGVDPVPITRIIVFHIRQSRGTYGTVLTGALPASLNRYGYAKRISLSLHRNYIFHGKLHSYLSATCAAPAGFPGAVFPFARASMTFADGRTLASTLTRSCKVRP